MSRPAYFVIQHVMGRSEPAIYWDDLPRQPLRNLEYVVRLDTLSPVLATMPLADLFAVYLRLKKQGKLPPRWDPKKKPAEATNA
jgi:hypothetical protein